MSGAKEAEEAEEAEEVGDQPRDRPEGREGLESVWKGVSSFGTGVWGTGR